MLEKIKEIILEYVEIDPSSITLESSLRTDLELDSLQLANLVVEIESAFSVEIDERDASSLQTIGDLIEYIKKEQK